MAKLLELNDAAKFLGVTPEKLQELRQDGEVRGMRDDSSWKFKQEDLDRYKEEQAAGGGGSFDESFDHLVPAASADDDSSSEMDSMSILVSEEELGQSPPTSSSTIIGKRDMDKLAAAQSDLKLAGDDDLLLAPVAGAGSGLSLDDDDGELLLSDERDLKKTGSGTGDLLPGKKEDASAILAFDDDALTLDEDAELKFDDSDDDMVLGGSSLGSDVALDAAGSGINLMSPGDSGLSLEDEPLELAGSAVESLELPEDDDVFTLDNLSADPEEATQLKADEEFLLSPLDDGSLEESSDSGSQVIALEDSDQFDENAATMLNAAQSPLLAEDTGDVMGAQLAGFGSPSMTASMATTPQYVQVPMPEAPYTVWNVVGLVSVVLSMSLSLMLMFDLLRNMWMWDGTSSATTSLMDGILSMFNLLN